MELQRNHVWWISRKDRGKQWMIQKGLNFVAWILYGSYSGGSRRLCSPSFPELPSCESGSPRVQMEPWPRPCRAHTAKGRLLLRTYPGLHLAFHYNGWPFCKDGQPFWRPILRHGIHFGPVFSSQALSLLSKLVEPQLLLGFIVAQGKGPSPALWDRYPIRPAQACYRPHHTL